MADKSFEAWLEDLTSDNPRTRTVAAYMLGELGDPRAIPALLDLLTDDNEDVRNFVVDSLGKLGDARLLEPLVAMLHDEDYGVRYNAVEALGNLGIPDAVDPLISRLGDQHWRVREIAIKSLDRIADPRAFDPLLESLFDISWQVREVAAIALGNLKNKKAAPALIELLLYDEADSLQADFARAAAAEALGKLGDSRAIIPLLQSLDNAEDYVPSAASKALRSFGERALPALSDALFSEHDTMRHEVAYLLGEIGSPKAVSTLADVLYANLTDESGEVDMIFIEYVIEALEKINTPEAHTALETWYTQQES